MDNNASVDCGRGSPSSPFESCGSSESTRKDLSASLADLQVPVDNCISFATSVLPWDPTVMSFARSAAGATVAAATTCAASRRVRSYVDIIRNADGFLHLTLLRSALTPPGIQSKPDGTFQIPLGMLSVHRVAPRFLICGAATGGRSTLASRANSTAVDDKASTTMDTLFGLEFESTETEASFIETVQQLQQQERSRHQQKHLQRGTAGDPLGEPGRAKGHLHQMEGSSVTSYFGYYERHSTQRDMLRDPTRTSAYRAALSQNNRDIRGKRVMDVGAGSGILSFFAAMQGAQRVYAVEASRMAATARALAEGNPAFGSSVEVLQQPVETLQLSQIGGERVDVLVSEPLGTLLFNERMIESYLFARDNFLKPGGLMFPRRSRLFCAPFMDAPLFAEVCSRGAFWQNDNFYGVDLRRAVPAATDEAFRQPIVDYVDPRCLVAEPQCTEFDFATIQVQDLHEINLSFTFDITAPCVIHGVATWFTVEFEGSDFFVGFSTGPDGAPTHWFQLRLLMRPPLAANSGQKIEAHIRMLATQQQSYRIDGKLQLVGTEFSSTCKDVDLKDPDYRYYTNPAQSYCPSQQPAESFWSFPSTAAPCHQNRSLQPTSPAPVATPASTPVFQRPGPSAWEECQMSVQCEPQQLLKRQQQQPLQQNDRNQQDEDDITAANVDMANIFRPS